MINYGKIFLEAQANYRESQRRYLASRIDAVHDCGADLVRTLSILEDKFRAEDAATGGIL